jgi:hypothetical protein
MDLFDKLQSLSGQVPAEQRVAAEEEEPSTVRKRPRTDIRTAAPPPGKERIIQQAKVVFNRTMLSLRRDKMATFMALAQPPILAILTALAGINQPKSIGVIFFLVVCAVWLGMTLTVREVVRERKLYIRDRLSGMHPLAYLLGKLAFAGCIVLVQGTVLWVLIKFLGGMFMRNPNASDALGRMSLIMGWIFVLLTGLGAAVLGLIVSTLSKSERAAVGFLPLVLLPQVVLSRTLTAEAKKDWSDPSPYVPMSYFISGAPMSGPMKLEIQKYQMDKALWEQRNALRMQPQLLHKLEDAGFAIPEREPTDPREAAERGGLGRGLNFLLSTVMLTRPASAAIDMLGEKPASESGIGTGTVTVEFLYLLILLTGYGATLYFLFMHLEKGWNDIRSA